MELYPLFFQPVYIKKVWGGQNLHKFYKRELPNNQIGESWEISDHRRANSRVINGPLTGKNLSWICRNSGQKLLGSIYQNGSTTRFPLLFKLLTPSDKLSIQVHPDDKIANLYQDDQGKVEMWYILAAKPGARIIYGLKDDSLGPDEIITKAAKGELADIVNYRPVSAGEVIFLPPGTIHALLDDVIVAEIHQNSDTTYRLYDWGRNRNRKLHLEKAGKAISSASNRPFKVQPISWVDENTNYWTLLASCAHFTAYKLELFKSIFLSPRKRDSFMIIFTVFGRANIIYKEKEYVLSSGKTCLLPASLDRVEITGNARLLIYTRGLKVHDLTQVHDLTKKAKETSGKNNLTATELSSLTDMAINKFIDL